MIENNRNISRDTKVSSIEERKHLDRYHAELSNTYHRMLKLYGQLKTVSTSVILTEAAIIDVLRSDTVADANTVVLNALGTVIYPSSVSSHERADVHPEYLSITAKIIDTLNVFVNSNDQIRTFVNLVRSSDNSLFLEAPDNIIENYIENVLTGDVPYIARFVKHDMGMSQISLEIRTVDVPYRINAIKYIPMPGVGTVTLDNILYDGITPIVMNGDRAYLRKDEYQLSRTMPGYIHFQPVGTDNLKLSVSSDKYVSKLGAVAIGISRITGELNIYSQISYAGFKVDYPEDMTKITGFAMAEDGYSESIDNVEATIYDNVNDFNAVNDNFIVKCGALQNLDITTGTDSVWVLVEITSTKGTTPSLESITMEFE